MHSGPGPRTAPGLTAPAAFSPSAPRSPHSLSRGALAPRAPRARPRVPRGPVSPRTAPRRRRPSSRSGRRTARRASGSRRDFPLQPAPCCPAPAPSPAPRPAGRRPWISPSAAAMAAAAARHPAPRPRPPARRRPSRRPPWTWLLASSAQLFRLRHLQLGLELRPEARAGRLPALELCARRPAPCGARVLDAHPPCACTRPPSAALPPPPPPLPPSRPAPSPSPPPGRDPHRRRRCPPSARRPARSPPAARRLQGGPVYRLWPSLTVTLP